MLKKRLNYFTTFIRNFSKEKAPVPKLVPYGTYCKLPIAFFRSSVVDPIWSDPKLLAGSGSEKIISGPQHCFVTVYSSHIVVLCFASIGLLNYCSNVTRPDQ